MLVRTSRDSREEPTGSIVVRDLCRFFSPDEPEEDFSGLVLPEFVEASLARIRTLLRGADTSSRCSCVVPATRNNEVGGVVRARARELTIGMIGRRARTSRVNSTDLSKAAEKCPLRSRSYLLQQFRIARRTQRACERSDARQRRRTVSPTDGSGTRGSIRVAAHKSPGSRVEYK